MFNNADCANNLCNLSSSIGEFLISGVVLQQAL